MLRSHSFRKFKRHVKSGTVTHYRRAKLSNPHCALCGTELHGISVRGGRTRRTNTRLFGGVLCANCTAEVVKLGSRIEHGDMKLDDISIKQRSFVLQLVAH